MRSHITDAENEVGGELSFRLQTPVLHHGWSTIARRNVGRTAKSDTKTPVVLCRIQVARSRIARDAGIEREYGLEACCIITRRCRKTVGRGLPKVAVIKRPIVNTVSAAENSLT